MLCTKIVLNVRNNFCTQHVLPRFELGIFMYWTCNSMNNRLSYFGLVDAKVRASDQICFWQRFKCKDNKSYQISKKLHLAIFWTKYPKKAIFYLFPSPCSWQTNEPPPSPLQRISLLFSLDAWAHVWLLWSLKTLVISFVSIRLFWHFWLSGTLWSLICFMMSRLISVSLNELTPHPIE